MGASWLVRLSRGQHSILPPSSLPPSSPLQCTELYQPPPPPPPPPVPTSTYKYPASTPLAPAPPLVPSPTATIYTALLVERKFRSGELGWLAFAVKPQHFVPSPTATIYTALLVERKFRSGELGWLAFAVKPQHFGGKLAGNTFLKNAHAQPTSNDERACVFLFSPPLGQGLCHGAASVQLVVYSDANSVSRLPTMESGN